MTNELGMIQDSSQYLATLLRRQPAFEDWLWTRKNLYRRYPLTGLFEDLQRSINGVDSFVDLLLHFREFKQRHFLRIGGRDLLGWADLTETTAQLSDLACVTLQVGLNVLMSHPDWWLRGEEKESWLQCMTDFQLVVMGLGKLGGQELNYVSDVDLLFLHAQSEGEEAASAEAVVYLNRLCQRLMRLLADSVEGDRVFQVDLRLRPRGKDGALVPSLAAAADHYLHAGRPWERQMLLKVRPVAGNRPLGMNFVHEVRPFVFRRFLDFQALDELRAMRDRILAEGVKPRPGWQQFDVKLGIGGIREVEFLVQSLQLIYGGRHPELDEPNTLQCLEKLRNLGLVSSPVVDDLKSAYIFLRRVEHWVQLDQNRQTQKLPVSDDARTRLSHALGFGGNEGFFLERLAECCGRVHGHFLALFEARSETGTPASPGAREADLEPGGLEAGKEFPPDQIARLQAHLDAFPFFLRQTVAQVLRKYGRSGDHETSGKVLVRLDRYFSQVRKRPGLVKVFRAAEPWLQDFCHGLARSELLADLLAHHPSLVEGLATVSGTCPDAETWKLTAGRLLAKSQNYEEGLEWVRRLKNERLLQLILADLRGDFDQEVLEQQLSALADFVVHNTYERVRNVLSLPEDLPLCVLALGKHGSLEMSYLSDLDLVFVYDPREGEADDQIPAEVIRLMQRFMRMLSTPLHEGPGYVVDARLRPTGNYGPLIVTRQSWREYYESQADIWEIQALLRVRNITGNHELGQWIERQAQDICYRKRDPAEVWRRICHLRQRMQRERSEERGDLIDIKLGMGGLADIEFLVQGHQLIEGYLVPALRERSVRAALRVVLARLHSEQVAAAETQAAFETMRCLEHRLRLHTNLPASRMSPRQFASLHSIGLWPPLAGTTAVENWHDVLRLRRRIRERLQQWCPSL